MVTKCNLSTLVIWHRKCQVKLKLCFIFSTYYLFDQIFFPIWIKSIFFIFLKVSEPFLAFDCWNYIEGIIHLFEILFLTPTHRTRNIDAMLILFMPISKKSQNQNYEFNINIKFININFWLSDPIFAATQLLSNKITESVSVDFGDIWLWEANKAAGAGLASSSYLTLKLTQDLKNWYWVNEGPYGVA